MAPGPKKLLLESLVFALGVRRNLGKVQPGKMELENVILDLYPQQAPGNQSEQNF